MATVTALKQIHTTNKVYESGETFEMDDKKAEFLTKRNAIKVVTKELKIEKEK